MTGFGEMIFQNGMEQGEKSIVEYMMKTGKYSLEEISAITGVSMETVEKISAGQVYGAEPRDGEGGTWVGSFRFDNHDKRQTREGLAYLP